MLKKNVLFMLGICGGILMSSTMAFSQGAKYDIKTMTPEIKQALESRRDRFDQLRELKKKGVLGENNRGYIEVVVAAKDAEKIADQENSDRKLIYLAIVEQNHLGGSLDVVEKVFAQVQRENAMKGEKIQNENGQWKAKE